MAPSSPAAAVGGDTGGARGFEIRPATLDQVDLDAVLALWIAIDVAALGFPDTNAEDVHAALSDPRLDLARDSWLVFAPDQRLVGYATVVDQNGSEIVAQRGLPAAQVSFVIPTMEEGLTGGSPRPAMRTCAASAECRSTRPATSVHRTWLREYGSA
jgi:hypothetical protein